MSIYRLYLPPEVQGNFSEEFRLIPDSKAIFALIAPPIWLIWNRLWLPLMAYFVVTLAIALVGAFYPGPLVAYLSVIPGFYLLLEGRELVLNKMRREGWREVAIIDAQNQEEAEIKYIVSADEAGLLTKVPNDTVRPTKRLAGASGPFIGLFPE